MQNLSPQPLHSPDGEQRGGAGTASLGVAAGDAARYAFIRDKLCTLNMKREGIARFS